MKLHHSFEFVPHNPLDAKDDSLPANDLVEVLMQNLVMEVVNFGRLICRNGTLTEFRNACRNCSLRNPFNGGLSTIRLLTSSSRGMKNKHDTTMAPRCGVIVVGGGHAGVEAACVAARMGTPTILITHKRSTLGEMSCNPSFGGIGKGHLMREVDALDGVCGFVCDKSGLQYRILNRSRGAAVWGYRAQMDRTLYKQNMQHYLNNYGPNLQIIEASVDDLVFQATLDGDPGNESETHAPRKICVGVITSEGTFLRSDCVVITTGTFLGGEIHLGLKRWPAGRINDEPSVKLAASLKHVGFSISRLKTGTPPRLDASTIDFERTQAVAGDTPSLPFSFLNNETWLPAADQMPTYIAYTNPSIIQHVHDSLEENIHVKEETRGPRYCPSLESKVLRYADLSHRIWLEPEGFDNKVIYPQGMSMTMPEEYQVKVINSVPGLERARILRPGYGVEYDFVDPRQLMPTLETKPIKNLFFAGQINGTTGYEEAAAQGIIAGINAACNALHKPPFVVSRTDGYIGVMIDDLTTQGVSEPYRIFTSRAEHRVVLRPDNADVRLTSRGREYGVVRDERWACFNDTQKQMNQLISVMNGFKMPWTQWNDVLASSVKTVTDFARPLFNDGTVESPPSPAIAVSKMQLFSQSTNATAYDVLRTFVPIETLLPVVAERCPEVRELALHIAHDIAGGTEQMRVRLKADAVYQLAARLQLSMRDSVKRSESIALPPNVDYYDKDFNVSQESRDRLARAQPVTLGAASRVHGISVDTLMALKYYVDKKNKSSPPPTADDAALLSAAA